MEQIEAALKVRLAELSMAGRTPADDPPPALVPVRAFKVPREDSPAPPPAEARRAAVPKMPPHEAAVVAAALAILDARLRAHGPALHSPAAVKSLLRLHLAEREREAFAVLFLDAQHRLIEFEVMFEGTLTQTSVHPRELVRRAMEHNAAAVILSHNHPSGVAEPSRADEFLTQTIKSALDLVDVRVLDHVVVGGADAVSLAERGMV